jgi:hypothetical protein
VILQVEARVCGPSVVLHAEERTEVVA